MPVLSGLQAKGSSQVLTQGSPVPTKTIEEVTPTWDCPHCWLRVFSFLLPAIYRTLVLTSASTCNSLEDKIVGATHRAVSGPDTAS